MKFSIKVYTMGSSNAKYDPDPIKRMEEADDGKSEITETMEAVEKYIHQTIKRLKEKYRRPLFVQFNQELGKDAEDILNFSQQVYHVRKVMTDLDDNWEYKEIFADLADAVERYANLKIALDKLERIVEEYKKYNSIRQSNLPMDCMIVSC